MRIDPDYLKSLLEAFEAAPDPCTNILALRESGFDYEDHQFVFHMRILEDKGFVKRDDGEPGFGMFPGIDGHVSWSVLPLRLTASGHEFLEALRNKEVWATIKKDFKEASIDTLWRVSKQLLDAYTKKKMNRLLGLDD